MYPVIFPPTSGSLQALLCKESRVVTAGIAVLRTVGAGNVTAQLLVVLTYITDSNELEMLS